MKKYFNKYILFAVAGTLALTGCEDSELPVDSVTEGVTRGAALRTVNLISNELPIGVEGAEFSAEFEIQDIEEGALVDNINVYVAYSDNTVATGAQDLDVAEALFATLSSADFVDGPFGLPRTSFSVSLVELLQFVGRSEADLFGGDFFPIRFELVLNDGRTFSSTNSNANNLGGSFYNSPFIYFPNVICPVPDTYFTGEYSITQTAGSAPFGIADGFTQSPVTVVANGSTNRTIDFAYDPGGFGSAYQFSLDLICFEIQNFSGAITGGSLGCSGGASSIGQTGVGVTPYDLADDSSFTINFEDFNPDGGCSGNTYAATIVLDKL